MRLSFFALMLALLAPLAALADSVDVVRVWPGWREASSFKRISEYFTGKEAMGNRTVLRTQPEARSGYYFLVRLENRGAALTAAKFVVKVILPTSPETKTYTLRGDLPAGSKVFNVGLTGTDWPDAKTRPVAWNFEVLDAQDHPVAAHGSFLWAMPAK